MEKKVFLAWQSQTSRRWFVIGDLSWNGESYKFWYTKGFMEAGEHGLESLSGFPRQGARYQSKELFPFFQNRLLKKTRSDYSSFIESLGLNEEQSDFIDILQRSSGKRVTDQYFIFGYPEIVDGYAEFRFFTHGLKYLASITNEELKEISEGDSLYLCHDLQNEYDSDAILVRTEKCLIGWCPRYLSRDFISILKDRPLFVTASIDGVNLPPSPIQFRFRCKLKSYVPNDFEFFSGIEYQPLVDFPVSSSSS